MKPFGPELPASFKDDGTIICRRCYVAQIGQPITDEDRARMSAGPDYPPCAMPRCEWCLDDIDTDRDHDTSSCPECVRRYREDREEFLADWRADRQEMGRW